MEPLDKTWNADNLSRSDVNGAGEGCTIVLDNRQSGSEAVSSDIPLTEARKMADKSDVPERILQMIGMYEYGDGSYKQKCLNFYRQGKFMEDYEDNAPWSGEFERYFPTYHDLTIPKLRGYFTWRTEVRKGIYRPIATSLAYIYLYELLNGIGTSSPEESLWRMQEFETEFLDTDIGDCTMTFNLHRWMLEFAVLGGLPAERFTAYLNPEKIQFDQALSTLQKAADCPDEAVVQALRLLAGKKDTGPADPQFQHLLAGTWRLAADKLFPACFGQAKPYVWHPLYNAVYYKEKEEPDRSVPVNDCRMFYCRDGIWHELRYERLFFDLQRLGAFLHRTECSLRRYLKTGHYLKEKPEEAWALPYVDAVIAADRREKEEAARPKIDIHLERLDHIREDAAATRESLLTAEEIDEIPGQAGNDGEPAGSIEGLNGQLADVLLMLLRGQSPESLLRERHLMPSVVADSLNEAFFDEIGDNVVECDGGTLSLVEDYREDIKQLLEI